MHGSDTRKMDDALLVLEYPVLPTHALTADGRDADVAADPGSDRNVNPDMEYPADYQLRYDNCTVAGRLHRYTYSWTNLAYVPQSRHTRKLALLRIDGYRNGYCGCPGESDYFQSPAISRQSAALDLAAAQALESDGGVCNRWVFPDVSVERHESRSGLTSQYSCERFGQTLFVFRVLERHSYELGSTRESLSKASGDGRNMMPKARCYVSSLDRVGNRSYQTGTQVYLGNLPPTNWEPVLSDIPY